MTQTGAAAVMELVVVRSRRRRAPPLPDEARALVAAADVPPPHAGLPPALVAVVVLTGRRGVAPVEATPPVGAGVGVAPLALTETGEAAAATTASRRQSPTPR